MDKEAEKLNSPIVSKMTAREWTRAIIFKTLAVFLTIFAVGCVIFGFAFDSAIRDSNIAGIVFSFFGGVFIVFGASSPLDTLTYIMQDKMSYSVVYADRVVIKVFLKDGRHTEINYACTDYTNIRENKKYFIVWANGKNTCVIKKRGLSDIQLNAVRGIFKLPVSGTAAELPKYSEREKIIPELSSVVNTDGVRCIKSSFDQYYSRDKSMLLPQRIVSALLILPCLFGMVCYAAACRTYGDPPPIWATLVMWASAVGIIAAFIWFMYLRRMLKRSDALEREGAISEYLIFRDKIIVFGHAYDWFSVTVIPYEKIARVRENKSDIYIDYPTKSGTYPVIKSTIGERECNTLRKLLSRKFTGDTVELDPAPSIDENIIKRPE